MQTACAPFAGSVEAERAVIARVRQRAVEPPRANRPGPITGLASSRNVVCHAAVALANHQRLTAAVDNVLHLRLLIATKDAKRAGIHSLLRGRVGREIDRI